MVDRNLDKQTEGMLSEFTGVDTTPYEKPEDQSTDLELDRLSLPIGANPERDWYVGQNELGEKTYRMTNGREYTIQRVIPQDRFTTEAGTSERLNEVLNDRVTGFVEGVKNAATAPGRALSGEGVTYGDVIDTSNYVMGFGTGLGTGSRVRNSRPLYEPEMVTIFGGPEAKNAPVRDVIESFNKESGRNNYESYVGPISVDEPYRTVRFNQILDDIEQNPGQYPETIAMLEANGWYTGRDNLLRFEIDDSRSTVDPSKFTYHTKGDIKNFSVGPQVSSRSYLPDVLDHPELFEQYPDLNDYATVVDLNLENTGTLGYFNPNNNTLALRPDLLKDPQKLRATLLHEANHAVQDIEGFESGSNQVSTEVYTINQAYLDSPEANQAFQDYEVAKATYDVEQPKVLSNLVNRQQDIANEVLTLSLENISEKTGVPVASLLNDLDTKGYLRFEKAYGFDDTALTALNEFSKGNFEVFGQEFSDLASLPTEELTNRVDVLTRFAQRFLGRSIARNISETPEINKTFTDTFGLSLDDVYNLSNKGSSLTYQDQLSVYGLEYLPKPVEPTIVDNWVIYSNNIGEVEARNVETRMDFTPKQRRENPPQTTEDRSPDIQWGFRELNRIRSGENPFDVFPTNMTNETTGMGKLTRQPEFAEGGSVENKTFNGMSDQEYRDWISSEVEKDPISRLGLDPSILNTVQTGIPYKRDPANNEQNAFYLNMPEGEIVGIGTDLVNSKGVQAHEFRHRGFQQLREYYNEDPEYFTERYGQTASNIVRDYLGDDNRAHEYDNEMWDNTSESFSTPSGETMSSDFGFEGNPEVHRRFSNFRRIIGPTRTKANAPKLDQELFDGYLQLERAAGDLINARNFSSGGLAMETQMNRLMAEGGLNDDGMRVDPVSGNEVPPGSMAEEVRDDIPAQLSGGEYVVPADVVRYYGVRFFEDLRGQAKEGLTEMEQDGRIGGEPAGMEQGPAGLSEEDMMMLQQIASQQQQGGYAEGGMVNQPFNEDALIDNIITVAKNNPDLMGKLNQRGVMLYEGGMVKPDGYADGGSVGSPTFNPADWGVVGGSYFGPSTSYQTPIENRTYRGPLGETITIRFQNGVAIDPIPTGFVPDAEYAAKRPTGVSGPVDNSRDRDQPFMGTSTPSAPTTSTTPDDPYTYRGADWNNPYEAGMEALAGTEGTIGNRLITGLAGAALGPLGGVASKGYLIGNGLANARANLRILEEKGMTEEADKLRAEIEKRTKDMNFAQDGLMDIFASGDRIFENLMNQINGRTTVSPTGVRTTGRVVSAADQLKDVAGLAAAKAMTPAQVEAGKTYASTGDSRDDSWSGGQVVSNQDKPAKTTSAQEARERAKAAADKLGKPLATGGRARGGLMGKANKT